MGGQKVKAENPISDVPAMRKFGKKCLRKLLISNVSYL